MDIEIFYRSWDNSFEVIYIWYDDTVINSHQFDITPAEVPAVALTMMEIQLQEAQA